MIKAIQKFFAYYFCLLSFHSWQQKEITAGIFSQKMKCQHCSKEAYLMDLY